LTLSKKLYIGLLLVRHWKQLGIDLQLRPFVFGGGFPTMLREILALGDLRA